MCRRPFSIRSAYFCLFLLSVSLLAQTATSPAPETLAPGFKAPVHPITAEQMHAYFSVCHILGVSRGLTHEKMELQRKDLPAWYPSAVWDEIEDAIDKIDLPEVALPVYQKYMSEERAAFLIKLFSLPQGQETVKAMVDAMVRAQHSGATPAEAHKLALAYIAPEEHADVARMVKKMTPAEKRDLEAHYSDLKRMQPLLAQIQQEYSQAVMSRQTDLVKEITDKRQAELREAKRNYNASH